MLAPLAVALLTLAVPAQAEEQGDLNKRKFILERALKKGDCNQALEMAEKLVAQQPGDVGLLSILGDTKVCLGDWTGAWSAYRDYLDNGGEAARIAEGMEQVEAHLGTAEISVGVASGLSLPPWEQVAIAVDCAPPKGVVESNPGTYLASGLNPGSCGIQVRAPELDQGIARVDVQAGQRSQVTIRLDRQRLAQVDVDTLDTRIRLRLATGGEGDPRSHEVVGDGSMNVPVGKGVVQADFVDQEVSYPFPLTEGTLQLPLPSAYQFNAGGRQAYALFAPGSAAYPVQVELPLPGDSGRVVKVVGELPANPGQVRTSELDLSAHPAVSAWSQLAEVNGDARKKKFQIGTLCLLGAGSTVLAAQQFYSAIGAAADARAVSDPSLGSDYESFVATGRRQQSVGVIAGTAGVAALEAGLTISLTLRRRLATSESRAQELFEQALSEPVPLGRYRIREHDTAPASTGEQTGEAE